MRITEITPTEGNIICQEISLEKSKSKIVRLDQSKPDQQAYKILCVNKKSSFKAGQIVIIAMNPVINGVIVGGQAYPIWKEYDIIGVVGEK